jgi:hypothetical protein
MLAGWTRGDRCLRWLNCVVLMGWTKIAPLGQSAMHTSACKRIMKPELAKKSAMAFRTRKQLHVIGRDDKRDHPRPSHRVKGNARVKKPGERITQQKSTGYVGKPNRKEPKPASPIYLPGRGALHGGAHLFSQFNGRREWRGADGVESQRGCVAPRPLPGRGRDCSPRPPRTRT